MVLNMNDQSMAKFICELRKSKNMTQKQLAERLHITDKAISKWERGLGYPDISILSKLAEILEVTTNELLKGERSAGQQPQEVNTVVEKTLEYANKVTFDKRKSLKVIAIIAITAACLLGIFITMVCNIAISGNLSWSLYPILSIPFAWLIIIPVFQFGKHKIAISLASISIFITPFLFILNKIIGSTTSILPIGIPVALVAIAYIWCVYILFIINKTEKYNMAAFSTLLGIPIYFLINYIVTKYTKESMVDVWDILSYGILAMASVVLFFLGKRRME